MVKQARLRAIIVSDEPPQLQAAPALTWTSNDKQPRLRRLARRWASFVIRWRR
jgi:hypothetical protein